MGDSAATQTDTACRSHCLLAAAYKVTAQELERAKHVYVFDAGATNADPANELLGAQAA